MLISQRNVSLSLAQMPRGMRVGRNSLHAFSVAFFILHYLMASRKMRKKLINVAITVRCTCLLLLRVDALHARVMQGSREENASRR